MYALGNMIAGAIGDSYSRVLVVSLGLIVSSGFWGIVIIQLGMGLNHVKYRSASDLFDTFRDYGVLARWNISWNRRNYGKLVP